MKTSKPRIILFCTLLLLSVSTSFVFAQTSRFSFNTYVSDKGDSLNYRMLFPDYDTLRRYPLVIFLHGSGERGSDNKAQLKWGVMNFATDQAMILHPAIVVAPQCPVHQEWSNFSEDSITHQLSLRAVPSMPMQLVIQLIHQLMKTLPIDSNRVYITGLSMGGYGTYDIIERYPHLFAAAVPVCGAGDTSKVASIAHIPIWIFQGAEDAAVNPMYSLDMVNALTKAGAHPGFTFYPEVGHFSWLAAYSDPLMMEWLFRQHK